MTTTADGLLVDWSALDPHIVSRGGGTFGVLLPGYAETSRPGAPVLPFTSVMVAVPPGATPILRVVQIEETDRSLPGPLALAPFPEGVLRDAGGRVVGGDFGAASAAQPAQTDEDTPVMLEPAGIARGVHLARLLFYPARPIGGYPQERLRTTTHVRVSLIFPGPIAGPTRLVSPDPLLAALRSSVINPEQVRPSISTLVSMPSAELESQILDSYDAGLTWIVEVAAPGLTAITYEDLARVGFPVAVIDPHALHLTRAGTEIAAEWDGNENASFEPGERLLFYAEPRSSRWTSTDAYFLVQGATPGLRIIERPAVLTGLPLGIAWTEETTEVNRLYTPDCFCGTISAGRDGDRWVWDDLRRPGRATNSYVIDLPAVDTAQLATLTMWLIGFTDVSANPDHLVHVDLNGAPVGRIEWDGKRSITATLPIIPGILASGVNTLTLTLPGMPGVAIEGVWVDAFSIRHAWDGASGGDSVIFSGQTAPEAYVFSLNSTTGLRVYDITSADWPLRLNDVIAAGNTITLSDPIAGGPHRYALTTEDGLQSPIALRPAQLCQRRAGFTGAGYVVIAPAEFIPAVDGLVRLREAQGMTVAVESVQCIYDAYGGGRPDPLAIRAYLAHAYAAWTPRPAYVLLVGDGSFDPRQYRAGSQPTFIPPFLANVDPWAGETAADNRYVAVDGQDTLPDMLIGRLPVKSLAETQVVVDKIVQYETEPIPGGWNKKVAFVADDGDEGGDFVAASEVEAVKVTVPFASQRIYFTPPATTIASIRQSLLESWNSGAFIIRYAGHSSWQQWAAEGFLHLDDLPALRNDRRWPIVFEMTCLTGAFHRPEPTLDEGLVTLPGGGAVAAWGATGMGLSTGHSSLDEGFFRAVFSDRVSTIGQATWAGQLSVAAAGQHLDLLDTFTLFGDPALRLDRNIVPWAGLTYLPIVTYNLESKGRLMH